MPTVDPLIAQGLPESLRKFMRDDCHLAPAAFQPLLGSQLPEPAKRLLDHPQDMTSTLAAFHESILRVEILQQRRLDELYLREVFLRTISSDIIVEYGVIAVALDQFTPPQRQSIEAGEAPLGALLHRFTIPFVSTPIGFFAIAGADLAPTPLAGHQGAMCHGRFNRLAKSTGEPLAWILEILPPA